MKHPAPVALILLSMFLAAQVIGLFVVNAYIDVSESQKASEEAGKPVTVYGQLPLGIERPAIAPDLSFIFMGVAIAAGTILILFLIKFRMVSLWKVWFFAAVFITLTIAFSAFISAAAAALISAFIAFFRIVRPNVLVHNVSELFVYGGLAAIFVPVINVKSAFVLLAAIAAYDIFAVFKSRHMISLARFQAENRVFAGLFVPKQMTVKSAVSSIKPASTKPQQEKGKYSDSGSYAVVGGGDIGFPLMFAGAAMVSLGMAKALFIPLFSTAALAILLLISQKGKFYPAMPFVAAGCFVGYGILQAL